MGAATLCFSKGLLSQPSISWGLAETFGLDPDLHKSPFSIRLEKDPIWWWDSSRFSKWVLWTRLICFQMHVVQLPDAFETVLASLPLWVLQEVRCSKPAKQKEEKMEEAGFWQKELGYHFHSSRKNGNWQTSEQPQWKRLTYSVDPEEKKQWTRLEWNRIE